VPLPSSSITHHIAKHHNPAEYFTTTAITTIVNATTVMLTFHFRALLIGLFVTGAVTSVARLKTRIMLQDSTKRRMQCSRDPSLAPNSIATILRITFAKILTKLISQASGRSSVSAMGRVAP
jgi:hypothetical protein